METMTITFKGLIKDQTILNAREQEALSSERIQMELLWSCASNRFKQDYTAFLTLKVNHNTRNGSQRKMVNPIAFKTTRLPFLNFSQMTEHKNSQVALLDTPYLFSSERESSEQVADRERLLNIHLKAANLTLDQAAQFGLRATRRIATILYRAHGGKGRLALPGVEGRSLISIEEALATISRRIDQNTFSIALQSAIELHRMLTGEDCWIRPDLRKECIGLALQRLINQLTLRF